MLKKNKILYILFLALIFLTGCSHNQPINTKTNISINKEIPFNYIFTGFVTVKNINDIPTDTVTFSSQKEWETFKEKYLKYEIPYSGYYAEPIDFNKQLVVYYSILDSKPDVYSTAFQIGNLGYENGKITVTSKPLDNNLKIIVENRENKGHRYVVVFAIDKNYLSK